MTEAGWTREKVTLSERDQQRIRTANELAAKWYTADQILSWLQRDRIKAMAHEELSVFLETHFRAAFAKGHFLASGITPDSYQQGRVAGIKQGIEKLREREKFYTEQEAISEGQMRLTRGLQRNESSCCIHELEKLAQAAQDEKGVEE